MKVFVSVGLVNVGERPLWLPDEAGSWGRGEAGRTGKASGASPRPSGAIILPQLVVVEQRETSSQVTDSGGRMTRICK